MNIRQYSDGNLYITVSKGAKPEIYRQGISAFGGISPTYRIALEKDSPVIVWDFHSLLVMVQICFSFILTDKDSDMRMCKHVKKPLLQAGRGMNFAARNVKISLMSINLWKRRRGSKEMIENRNVNIITDADGKKLVLSKPFISSTS